MKARGALLLGALAGLVAAAVFTAGYRAGRGRARLCERRLAEAPESAAGGSAPRRPEPPPTRPPPPVPTTPAAEPGAAAAAATDPVALEPPFALDLGEPLRISWPLDVGPDCSPDRPDARVCLRARQGANELQEPGRGKALYPFRLAKAGRCAVWLRVRWADDGVGSVDCNNSWFAGLDDLPAAVVGNEETRTDWFWARGPAARLEAGTHWLRLELREDGPAADRAVIVSAQSADRPEGLDRVVPARFGGFAGEAPPGDPQNPIGEVEIAALPTGSLAVGQGHRNEITLCAWWQLPAGAGAKGFAGTVELSCPTAPGLTVTGERELAVGPAAPFVRRTLGLEFPAAAARRPHPVTVTLAGGAGGAAARRVFRDELRFVKGPAWAFLGPFREAAEEARPAERGADPARLFRHPGDRQPRLLAERKGLAELGWPEARRADAGAPVEWKLVEDGSCYDWTGAVDLLKVFGRTNSGVAYAVTWIQAQTELRHRSFVFAGDDAGWLWINDSFIAVLPVDLPREANRLWSSARLAPGANPVAVKLYQQGRYWGFRFDVVDWHWQGRRGDLITALEPAAWPR